MTTDLAAWLFAAISIEDPAARDLTATLDQAVQLLQEDASSRDEAADNAEPAAKTPEDRDLIGNLREEAFLRWSAADSLSDWASCLNAALMLPLDQREPLA